MFFIVGFTKGGGAEPPPFQKMEKREITIEGKKEVEPIKKRRRRRIGKKVIVQAKEKHEV